MVTHPDARQATHRAPRFLPDGRHLLYFAAAGSERGVYLTALDGQQPRRLLEADAGAAYAPPGFLLFTREGDAVRATFRRGAARARWNAAPVAQQVAASGNVTAVDAASNGLLVYRTQPPAGHRQLVWFDRSGKTIGTVSDPDDASPANPELSPDDRQVALDRSIDGNRDVWLIETTRGVATRLTFDPANDSGPIWSPDGARIVFRSGRKAGVQDLYQKLASGAGSDELLFASPVSKAAEDWSPTGRFVLFRALETKTGRDLWALPLQGDREPIPVVKTEFEERDGQFSPDGRWIAYTSNASGRVEVYVQPFPGPGGKWQISTAGGTEPRWRRDGRELFYLASDGALDGTAIALKPDGQANRGRKAGVAVHAPHPRDGCRRQAAVRGLARRAAVSDQRHIRRGDSRADRGHSELAVGARRALTAMSVCMKRSGSWDDGRDYQYPIIRPAPTAVSQHASEVAPTTASCRRSALDSSRAACLPRRQEVQDEDVEQPSRDRRKL